MSDGSAGQFIEIFEKVLNKTWRPIRKWILNRKCIKDILIGLNTSQDIQLRDDLIKFLKDTLDTKVHGFESVKQDAEQHRGRAIRLEEEMNQLRQAASFTFEEQRKTIDGLFKICDKFSSSMDKYTVLEDMVMYFTSAEKNISYAMLSAMKTVVFNRLTDEAVSSMAKSIKDKKVPHFRQLAALQLLVAETSIVQQDKP